MKKSGLQDMKKRNETVIVNTVLEQEALSRIEIANLTKLSPSTVSSLVTQLLEKQVLVESGVRVTTAGRSRTELTINGEYGNILIAEIGRTGAVLYCYDMALRQKSKAVLSEHYIAGNDLLVAITAAVFQCMDEAQLHRGKLVGFGLLFQEDMHASEFNVMYSTGFSAASISLREALITQFRVPVLEEYSQAYSLSQALAAPAAKVENSACISVDSRVILAGITLGGRPVELRGGMCADITPLLGGMVEQLPDEGTQRRAKQDAPVSGENWAETVVLQLSRVIAALCTIFPLEKIFLSGKAALVKGFVEQVSQQTAAFLPKEQMPKLEAVRASSYSVLGHLAGSIRRYVLCG